MIESMNSLIRDALIEDVGHGDISTNATVPANARCRARVIAKQNGILSGIDVCKSVFQAIKTDMANWTSHSDGDRLKTGDVVASFEGNTRAVLTGERTALNFAQRLSGIATLTAQFVEIVDGTHARICSTRKTNPLMRMLEKQAVVHGGGTNHRFALYDGILIKENHVVAAGGISEAVKQVRESTHHLLRVEVEVTCLEEVDEVLKTSAEVMLLDNMSLEDMREAAQRAQTKGVMVEASGNISLSTVRAVAETGVDVISVGELTHSAPAFDLSLLIENV